jgi:hypothetical protein
MEEKTLSVCIEPLVLGREPPIRDSVKKWEWIADGIRQLYDNIWGETCPLCAKYELDCTNGKTEEPCPVYAETGRTECENTPWYKVRAGLIAAMDAADDEAEFLRGLENGNK